jgi:hypothetical protein
MNHIYKGKRFICLLVAACAFFHLSLLLLLLLKSLVNIIFNWRVFIIICNYTIALKLVVNLPLLSPPASDDYI